MEEHHHLGRGGLDPVDLHLWKLHLRAADLSIQTDARLDPRRLIVDEGHPLLGDPRALAVAPRNADRAPVVHDVEHGVDDQDRGRARFDRDVQVRHASGRAVDVVAALDADRTEEERDGRGGGDGVGDGHLVAVLVREDPPRAEIEIGGRDVELAADARE